MESSSPSTEINPPTFVCHKCRKNVPVQYKREWKECDHSVCQFCFFSLFKFEKSDQGPSLRLACHVCNIDIDAITSPLTTADIVIANNLFLKKACKQCQKIDVIPVALDILCKTHAGLCMDCGSSQLCQGPCPFASCVTCISSESSPSGSVTLDNKCFRCGTCKTHTPVHLDIANKHHRRLITLCSHCFKMQNVCPDHVKIPAPPENLCQCPTTTTKHT